MFGGKKMESAGSASRRRVSLLACALALFAACATGEAPSEAWAATPPLRVVLLGDSYAAGNGAGDYWGPAGCYRSHSNWAERYLRALRSEYHVIFTNQACSGSVIADVSDGGKMARQWDAVDPSTDLVLMSIGGNDLGFANIVAQCFVLGIRDPHDCKDGIDHANARVGAVRSETISLLRGLKERMRSGAKIVLNSYPYLEKNPDLTLGRELFGIGTSYPVGREIRALGDRGEAAQREAVATVNGEGGTGVVYMDQIKGLFAGHEPDGRVTRRNPDRWIHEFDSTTSKEWYHYNTLGHEAIGALLAGHSAFGADTSLGSIGAGAVDIAFLIDTTGSMGSSIDSAKAAAELLISEVQSKTGSARFAVIDYRDFPERTGEPADYPAFLDQGFTADGELANEAIQSLTLGYGGDGPETMYSALHMAFGLSWRPGVKKVAVILADAPPLSPEPISGLTKEQIIEESLALDPAEVHLVDVGSAADPDVTEITEQTNGGIHPGTPSTAAEEIGGAIDESLDRPFAWAGGPYVGAVGTSFEFDGSGSYGIGSEIVKWEWDFDGDGETDLSSGSPGAVHTYHGEYEGLVALKVTDAADQVGLATSPVSVSKDGDGIPDGLDNCPEDANIGQEDEDGDGLGDACDPTPGFPTEDLPGVFDELGSRNFSQPAVESSGAAPATPTAGIARPARLRFGWPRLDKRRTRLKLPARCASTGGACRGRLLVRIGGAGRLRRRYAIGPAKRRVLRLRIRPSMRRRLLRARRNRVRVTVVTRPTQAPKQRRTWKLRLNG